MSALLPYAVREGTSSPGEKGRGWGWGEPGAAGLANSFLQSALFSVRGTETLQQQMTSSNALINCGILCPGMHQEITSRWAKSEIFTQKSNPFIQEIYVSQKRRTLRVQEAI